MIVTVLPTPVELAIVKTPARPSTEVTPLPLVAKPQLVLPCKQMVPLSLGTVIVRLAVGAVKPRVLVKPLALALKVDVELPCKANVRLLAPIVKLPPGVIVKLALL